MWGETLRVQETEILPYRKIKNDIIVSVIKLPGETWEYQCYLKSHLHRHKVQQWGGRCVPYTTWKKIEDGTSTEENACWIQLSKVKETRDLMVIIPFSLGKIKEMIWGQVADTECFVALNELWKWYRMESSHNRDLRTQCNQEQGGALQTAKTKKKPTI